MHNYRFRTIVLLTAGLLAAAVLAGLACRTDTAGDIFTEEYRQAMTAVAPVLAEMYPTPLGDATDGSAQPTPDIEAARARFVEGGELLPGGGRLCLRPDGSGAIVMPGQTLEYNFMEQTWTLIQANEELLEEDFAEACPDEFR